MKRIGEVPCLPVGWHVDQQILFGGWQSIGRTVLLGALTYATLLILLRVSGKRALSKMNAFDLVVTVALGSTLATIIVSPDVSLSSGIAALVTLIGMQYSVAWASMRSALVNRLARAEPRLLVRKGQLLLEAMKSERVSPTEIASALRHHGIASMEDVDAVILETDGSFSVIQTPAHSTRL